MRIQHPTSSVQHPTPGGVPGALDVRRSLLKAGRSQNGSVLIIVLWVCVGLVSIALYFANSMTYELRASDNRVSGLTADQAIEGASRYVSYVLYNYATNGAVPDAAEFSSEAVPIGDAKFWLIGRDTTGQNTTGQSATDPAFGLVDEGSKLNLNYANTNMLSYLPNMTVDFAQAITDWRTTNGTVGLDYSTLGYYPKYAPFETEDELRLVYGASVDLLVGDDLNRNGVLDGNETDSTGLGQLNSGLFEYTTVWTREPNFHSDGSSLTNVSMINHDKILALFQNAGLNTANVNQLTNRSYASLLAFALRCQQNAGMSEADFSRIFDYITTSTNTYFFGRVNVNTASSDVLTALLMGLNVDQQTASGAVDTIVSYREQNPGNLNTIWWLIDALGNNSSVITALAGGNYVTTKSYQFTADIAAVGPFGRGYRRVKFIFDTSGGTPTILYRQDLSRLGWALGDKARQTLLANNTTQ
jgi:DNA uptake protein ComE-like DNA-binding protein